MTQLLDIFGFLSVLLRGFTLVFEALAVGGVVFQFCIARELATERGWKWVRWSAVLLACTQACLAGANAAILIGTTDLGLADIVGAGFVAATALIVGGAMVIVLTAHRRSSAAAVVGCVLILAGSTMLSHSAARVESRWILITLTLLHHAAGAAWIGGLPYLHSLLNRDFNGPAAAAVASRFSHLALASVGILTSAGATLGFLYVGSPGALGGTTYGIMLAAKIMKSCIILLVGDKASILPGLQKMGHEIVELDVNGDRIAR